MVDFHFYEPANGHGLRHDPFNSIVAPRPIGWISTRDGEGGFNLAPYSFFNAFNYVPPIIGFSSIGRKDTLRNVEKTGEFVWNLADQNLASAMNQTSAPIAQGHSEFDFAKLDMAASRLVGAPRVAASPVSFECKLTQILQLKTRAGDEVNSWLVLGEVVGVHIRSDTISDGVFDTVLAKPVLRGGGPGDFFTISENARFQMLRPTAPG